MGRLFAGTEFYQPAKCDRCGELEDACRCPPAPTPRIPPEKQTAKLSVEKRKKGKVVTVVRGLPAQGNDLAELLGILKTGTWGIVATLSISSPFLSLRYRLGVIAPAGS